MSTEQNKATEQLMVAEVLNKGNLEYIDKCIAPDFQYHGPSGASVKGIEGEKQFIAGLRAAYPDIHVTIQDILAEGDMVATRTLCTFTSPVKANDTTTANKKVVMAGSIIERFRDGKIVETWELYDRLDLLQQLGIIPAREGSGS
jgi:predicted ester cyclase